MKSSIRTMLLAFAVLGLGASAVASYVHYRLLTDPSYTSFCDVSSTVSCTQAYLSRYGSFAGVPVALGGLFFFTLVLVIAGFTGRPASGARENAPAYIFALSTLGLAFVLYLAWASYFVLGIFCFVCATTYLAVVAIFILSGGATSFPMTSLPARARRDVRTLVSSPAALVIVLLFVAGAVTVIAAFPKETAPAATQAPASYPPVTDEERAKLAQWWDLQPKVDVPVADGGAKVVIVKFNDYQCPPCRLTHESYKGIIAKYAATGQVNYVLKHFPLENECNTLNAGHLAACEAAAAVILARPKGTASKMEEWLFTNQGPPQLTPAQVRQAARNVAGVDDFDTKYATALQEVRADSALGGLLGVNSTPTFFINGRKVPQILAPQYFAAIIELELKRAK